MTEPTNLADAEGLSDFLAERPEPDRPDPADILEGAMRVGDPNHRICVARWRKHDRAEWSACDYCQGSKPLCSWRNDRCQHRAFIDDPTTTFDPIARRYYCDVLTRETTR